MDVLELCDAGYAGENGLADCRQEGNHRMVVVSPPYIEEENNVRSTTPQAFSYAR